MQHKTLFANFINSRVCPSKSPKNNIMYPLKYRFPAHNIVGFVGQELISSQDERKSRQFFSLLFCLVIKLKSHIFDSLIFTH